MKFRVRALSIAFAALTACAPQTPNDAAVCSAFAARRSHVEVVADGTVTRVLGVAAGRVSPHEGFLLRLNSGCRLTVRVEANTDFTGNFVIGPGDRAIVKGEYEYYALGGVIHWTHRDPRGRHESGYVDVRGNTYD